jgi:saccharopine dehydrogenase-like NADP-dependent oxidoreductase
MGAKILILGAGKSATVLVHYLQQKAVENNWYVILADGDELVAKNKWNNAQNGHAIGFDIQDMDLRAKHIKEVDLVISMLPATLHLLVAKDCLAYFKPLFTASYVDDQLKALAPEIEAKNLFFLCEMGLDPGIDHMSAMELIHRIQNKGGIITHFKSHCGGLIAPESDTNPWHYKISWNPRNIILAGKAGALFLEKGNTKELHYEQLFNNAPQVQIPNLGPLAYYPNRNSLSYIATYQLKGIQNFVRTTLRHPQFCSGWDAIIQLALTTETTIPRNNKDTIQSWFDNHISVNNLIAIYNELLLNIELKKQIEFIDLNAATPIPISLNSNAAILQWILESKWKLSNEDKDMVVMVHEFKYMLQNQEHNLISSMVVKGNDSVNTAMAKTVGLPLAMSVCAYLKGEINLTGLHIPTHPIIYQPILKKLAEEGIVFKETEM